jgi:hypothetical protein
MIPFYKPVCENHKLLIKKLSEGPQKETNESTPQSDKSTLNTDSGSGTNSFFEPVSDTRKLLIKKLTERMENTPPNQQKDTNELQTTPLPIRGYYFQMDANTTSD